MNLDRLIHEPARLRIMVILAGVASADFKFLWNALGITKGNLSSHMDRLEQAGYVAITKSFNGKMPHTDYQITVAGQKALDEYWRQLDLLRNLEPFAARLGRLGRGKKSDPPR